MDDKIDRCYEDLANAIVMQAVDDYRSARQALHYNCHDGHARWEIKSIREFFRSAYFGILTSVDPEYLIRKLDGE